MAMGGARRDLAARLEAQIVARARAPVFFASLGVPDTMDGRFDMMALHSWLVLERLKKTGMDDTAQALTDTLFTSFDEALREQGTGDMGMSRRIKAMAEAFFGRLKAYAEAGDEETLAAAIARNVWRGRQTDANARILASYVTGARAALAASRAEDGDLDFGPLPA